MQLLLSDEKDADASQSINARLLSAGLARFQAPKHKATPFALLDTLTILALSMLKQ